LREELAVEEAASNPAAGRPIKNIKMNDSRWPSAEGWQKWQQVIEPGGSKINVHYTYNPVTGQMDDFKIVLPKTK